MSYQTFEQSLAGKDFIEFINKEKETAIELGMTSENADARGRYQFIKSLEKHLYLIKKDAEFTQKNNRR